MMDQQITPFGGADATTVREQATTMRANTMRALARMEQEQKEKEAALKEQMRSLEEQMRRASAELAEKMAPMRAEMAKMQEVMWTADLYLGRQEDLRTLREGKPAPADTPITIRQRVLIMAEESLLYMENGGTGMSAVDGRGLPDFIRWLLADDANLNRVLPELKGVVAMIPTQVKSDSGNIWEDSAKNAINSQTYWLIRNGERLYLMTTDPELRAVQRILPRRAEFTEVFEQRLFGFSRDYREPVRPGSDEWMEMEKQADARRRHYMRLMLVLQGLIDRTTVWHPLPLSGINLLDVRMQDEGKVVLIQDAEDSIALTDGRESFSAWQRRLNGLMRPGLRIVGNWGAKNFTDLYLEGDRYFRGSHPRVSPNNAEYPESGVPHLIEDRRDGGFVIRYKRTEQIWKRGVSVPGKPGYVYTSEQPVGATRRASCLVKVDDDWVIPFDLATVEDMRYFLSSRENRSRHFLSMVPVLKAALAAKEAEVEAEAPFRDLLKSLLLAEGADETKVSTVLDGLVHDWKVTNTYARSLNGEPQHEAKAAREIVAAYRKSIEHQGDDKTAAMVAAGRRVPNAVAVARNNQGKWFVYAASQPAHDKGVYLDVTPIRRYGTLGQTKREQIVAQRSVSALHVAWSAPEWDTWKFGANPRHYLTESERQEVIGSLLDQAPGLPMCVVEYFDSRTPTHREFGLFYWVDGTPESANQEEPPPRPNWYTSAPEEIKVKIASVSKNSKGITTKAHSWSMHISSEYDYFFNKDNQVRWEHTPWWPDNARQYSNTRPRLAWADENMLDRYEALKAARKAAKKARKQAKRERQERAYPSVALLVEAMQSQIMAQALEKFIEDFGKDAMDLWPREQGRVDTEVRVHQEVLANLLIAAGVLEKNISGMTLGQIIDCADEQEKVGLMNWTTDSLRRTLKDLLEVKMPRLEAAGAEA